MGPVDSIRGFSESLWPRVPGRNLCLRHRPIDDEIGAPHPADHLSQPEDGDDGVGST